ncbi:unnamed protein product [Brassicogethes aeneus]|uniref:C2H2-type domain-containing protein n=1 Tax=Brassicogethes aeneus TaxID=1431903 RepID=A0A9P0AUU2_BRAAE|nr:unnamed protein product [Brassicogethes aeneus]
MDKGDHKDKEHKDVEATVSRNEETKKLVKQEGKIDKRIADKYNKKPNIKKNAFKIPLLSKKLPETITSSIVNNVPVPVVEPPKIVLPLKMMPPLNLAEIMHPHATALLTNNLKKQNSMNAPTNSFHDSYRQQNSISVPIQQNIPIPQSPIINNFGGPNNISPHNNRPIRNEQNFNRPNFNNIPNEFEGRPNDFNGPQFHRPPQNEFDNFHNQQDFHNRPNSQMQFRGPQQHNNPQLIQRNQFKFEPPPPDINLNNFKMGPPPNLAEIIQLNATALIGNIVGNLQKQNCINVPTNSFQNSHGQQSNISVPIQQNLPIQQNIPIPHSPIIHNFGGPDANSPHNNRIPPIRNEQHFNRLNFNNLQNEFEGRPNDFNGPQFHRPPQNEFDNFHNRPNSQMQFRGSQQHDNPQFKQRNQFKFEPPPPDTAGMPLLLPQEDKGFCSDQKNFYHGEIKEHISPWNGSQNNWNRGRGRFHNNSDPRRGREYENHDFKQPQTSNFEHQDTHNSPSFRKEDPIPNYRNPGQVREDFRQQNKSANKRGRFRGRGFQHNRSRGKSEAREVKDRQDFQYRNQFDLVDSANDDNRPRSRSPPKESFHSPLDSWYVSDKNLTEKDYEVQNVNIPKIKKDFTKDIIKTAEDESNVVDPESDAVNSVEKGELSTQEPEATSIPENPEIQPEVVESTFKTTTETPSSSVQDDPIEESKVKTDKKETPAEEEKDTTEEVTSTQPHPQEETKPESSTAEQNILAKFFANLMGSGNKEDKKGALLSLISTFTDSFSDTQIKKITNIIKDASSETDEQAAKTTEKERAVIDHEEEKPVKIEEVSVVKAEPVQVSVGESIKKKKRTTPTKPKRHKTELELLPGNIQDMFIRDGELTANGKRMCRMLKSDPKALNTDTKDKEKNSEKKIPKEEDSKNAMDINYMTNVKVVLNRISPKELLKLRIPKSLFLKEEIDAEPSSISLESEDLKKGEKEEEKIDNENTKKKKVTKRKRKTFWTSGLNKKRKKRKADKDKLIAETTDKPFVKPHVCYLKEKNKMQCKLCPFSSKYLAHHYIMNHPEEEMWFTRLTKENAKLAVEDAKVNMKKYEQLTTAFKLHKKYQFACCFCKYNNSMFPISFYDHVTLHTGEFRYKCQDCNFVNNNRKGIKNHIQKNKSHKRHALPSKLSGIYTFLFMCNECNYCQIDKGNVKKHVNNTHGKNVKITKIISSTLPILDADDKDSLQKRVMKLEKDEVETKTKHVVKKRKCVKIKAIIEDKEINKKNNKEPPRKKIKRDKKSSNFRSPLMKALKLDNPDEESKSSPLNASANFESDHEINSIVLQKQVKEEATHIIPAAEIKKDIETIDFTCDTDYNEDNLLGSGLQNAISFKSEPDEEDEIIPEPELVLLPGIERPPTPAMPVLEKSINKSVVVEEPVQKPTVIIERPLTPVMPVLEKSVNKPVQPTVINDVNVKACLDQSIIFNGCCVQVIKNDDILTYSCQVLPCVYSCENQASFMKHCKEQHANIDKVNCDVCKINVDGGTMEDMFRHVLNVHLNEFETSPRLSLLKMRRLSGDQLSTVIDITGDLSNSDMEKDKIVSENVIKSEIPEQLQDIQVASVPEQSVEFKNPFEFKISGVMSLAEEPVVSPLRPLKLTPTKINSNIFWSKMNDDELKKPKKSQFAMAKFLTAIRDLYKCPVYSCMFSSNFRDEFESHLNKHKLTPKSLFLPCVYCDYKMLIDNVTTHIDVSHGKCRYACGYCMYRTMDPDYVYLHHLEEHKDKEKYRIVQVGTTAVACLATEPQNTCLPEDITKYCKPYHCKPCQKSFLFENDFKRNMLRHNLLDLIQCGFGVECSALEPTNKMVQHWNSVHNVCAYQCGYCFFSAPNQVAVFMHQVAKHFNQSPKVYCRINPNENADNLFYSSEAMALLPVLRKLPDSMKEPEAIEAPPKAQPQKSELKVASGYNKGNSLLKPPTKASGVTSTTGSKLFQILPSENLISKSLAPNSKSQVLKAIPNKFNSLLSFAKTSSSSLSSLPSTSTGQVSLLRKRLSFSKESQPVAIDTVEIPPVEDPSSTGELPEQPEVDPLSLTDSESESFLQKNAATSSEDDRSDKSSEKSSKHPEKQAFTLCEDKWTTAAQIRSHLKTKHNVSSITLTPPESQQQNIPELNECGWCGYTDKVNMNFVRHLLTHSKEKAVPDSAPVNPMPCSDKIEKMFDKMTNLAFNGFQGSKQKTEKGEERETLPEAHLDVSARLTMVRDLKELNGTHKLGTDSIYGISSKFKSDDKQEISTHFTEKHPKNDMFDVIQTQQNKSPDKKTPTSATISKPSNSATHSTPPPSSIDSSLEAVTSGNFSKKKSLPINENFIAEINKETAKALEKLTNEKFITVLDDDEEEDNIVVKQAKPKDIPPDIEGRLPTLEKEMLDPFHLTHLIREFGGFGNPFNKQFNCPVCDKFKSKQVVDFIFHLYIEKKTKRFMCTKCSATSVSYDLMCRHVKGLHDTHTPWEVIKPLPRHKKLEVWIQELLRAQADTIILKQGLVSAKIDSDKPKIHECEFCGEKYFSKVNIQEHQLVHWRDKPFQCGSCSFSDVRREKVVEHWKKEHKGECKLSLKAPLVATVIANRDESDKASYKDAVNLVEEENDDVTTMEQVLQVVEEKEVKEPSSNKGQIVFICDLCAVYTFNQLQMEDHAITKHNSTKCFKRFMWKAYVDNPNYNVHCWYCDVQGPDLMVRDHHSKKHAENKYQPYKFTCELCPQRYASSEHFKMHFAREHNNAEVRYRTFFKPLQVRLVRFYVHQL